MSASSETVATSEKSSAASRASGAARTSNPARPRPLSRKGAVSVKVDEKGNEKALIVAGVLILALVGYVGYRTQVLGESLAQVFPFFGSKDAASSESSAPADAGGDSAAGIKSVPKARSSEDDNTLFGRRTSGR